MLMGLSQDAAPLSSDAAIWPYPDSLFLGLTVSRRWRYGGLPVRTLVDVAAREVRERLAGKLVVNGGTCKVLGLKSNPLRVLSAQVAPAGEPALGWVARELSAGKFVMLARADSGLCDDCYYGDRACNDRIFSGNLDDAERLTYAGRAVVAFSPDVAWLELVNRTISPCQAGFWALVTVGVVGAGALVYGRWLDGRRS